MVQVFKMQQASEFLGRLFKAYFLGLTLRISEIEAENLHL
jgi:hypothetical protein